MTNSRNNVENHGIEDNNYLCIDGSEKREQGRYCICNESKKLYIEATPQTKAF